LHSVQEVDLDPFLRQKRQRKRQAAQAGATTALAGCPDRDARRCAVRQRDSIAAPFRAAIARPDEGIRQPASRVEIAEKRKPLPSYAARAASAAVTGATKYIRDDCNRHDPEYEAGDSVFPAEANREDRLGRRLSGRVEESHS
jgi:hypothetical protein